MFKASKDITATYFLVDQDFASVKMDDTPTSSVVFDGETATAISHHQGYFEFSSIHLSGLYCLLSFSLFCSIFEHNYCTINEQ